MRKRKVAKRNFIATQADDVSTSPAYEEMKKYDLEDSLFYLRSLKKSVFSYYKQFTSCSNVLPATFATCHRTKPRCKRSSGTSTFRNQVVQSPHFCDQVFQVMS